MLTDLHRKKLPNLFNLHDTDNDGVMRKEDFDVVAHNLAQARGVEADSGEEAELHARFAAAWDRMAGMADSDGGITLDGWFAFWEHVLSTDGMYDQVISPIGDFVFYLLDQDDSGRVGSDEYMTFYDVMGLDTASAEEAFSKLDQDGDGSLSRSEISDMLEQYFCSADPSAPGNWFFGPYA